MNKKARVAISISAGAMLIGTATLGAMAIAKNNNMMKVNATDGIVATYTKDSINKDGSNYYLLTPTNNRVYFTGLENITIGGDYVFSIPTGGHFRWDANTTTNGYTNGWQNLRKVEMTIEADVTGLVFDVYGGNWAGTKSYDSSKLKFTATSDEGSTVTATYINAAFGGEGPVKVTSLTVTYSCA